MTNSDTSLKPVHVIGAGLAGSEASWQIAEMGVPVILHEMRPDVKTDAHQTGGFAELVCSNSFRSDDASGNAVGLLHEEMRRARSLIMREGDTHKLPAGGALAVDRDLFSGGVEKALHDHPLITVEYGEVAVYKDSIDFDIAWMQSRYDKKGPGGDGADYINCPFNKEQYETFVQALVDSDQTEFKDWEKDTPYFESCLPIEVIASRGPETLRWGPMKPVGLTNPHDPTVKSHAIAQLRQDNALGTLYNMVGFQTKMKYGAQAEILKTIPGLENAVFARLGGIHRNTFINSPKLLNKQLQLNVRPSLRFAGQIMGVEGYVESAALGLITGRMAAAQALGNKYDVPPVTTALGALVEHVTGGFMSGPKAKFQPMNVNFGLFPPIELEYKTEDGKRIRGKDKTRFRKAALSKRALNDIMAWV